MSNQEMAIALKNAFIDTFEKQKQNTLSYGFDEEFISELKKEQKLLKQRHHIISKPHRKKYKR